MDEWPADAILGTIHPTDWTDLLPIPRADHRARARALTARRPTKSDWAEEDRRARSPPAKPKRGGLPFFSPRKNPDGSEHVAAKRMSRKDVRQAEGAEARQKERAAALKVTKPSASSTSNPSGAASTSSDVEAASRAAAGSSAAQLAAQLARLLWSTLVFFALVAAIFVVCVALDQRGAFPDVMTPRSMRAFAERAVAGMSAANLSASVDAYAEAARRFGAAGASVRRGVSRGGGEGARVWRRVRRRGGHRREGGAGCRGEGDERVREVNGWDEPGCTSM